MQKQKMVAGGEAKEVKNEKVDEKKENEKNSVGFENVANIVGIGKKGGEEKPAQSVSIEEDFVGFYKSFILELGGVRVTCYDNKGNEVFKYDVLPEQFRGSSLGLETDYIENKETIILSSEMNIDTSSSKFSDAIPQLTSGGGKGKKVDFIRFDNWTEYKDIESWAGSEENIKKFIDDIAPIGAYLIDCSQMCDCIKTIVIMNFYIVTFIQLRILHTLENTCIRVCIF